MDYLQQAIADSADSKASRQRAARAWIQGKGTKATRGLLGRIGQASQGGAIHCSHEYYSQHTGDSEFMNAVHSGEIIVD